MRICVITGANAGIGKVTARELAKQGMHIVMLCRNEAKGKQAQQEIAAQTGANVDLLLMDLASQASVRQVAQQIHECYDHIDVLVNNAGLILEQPSYTPDGFESTFAINHLGPFLLTNLLLDLLKKGQEPRVITVSSDAHKWSQWDLNDLSRPKKYSPLVAYGNSKLANILFSNELSKRVKEFGITSNSLHPGAVKTNFGQGQGSGPIAWLFNLARPFFLTPEQGAETSIYLASSPEVKGVTGKYFAKKKAVVPNKNAQSEVNARMLWEKSEEWTGLKN